jgi:argininosuccinate lyase
MADLQAVEPGITEDVFDVLTVSRSVASRRSHGGTSPERVREAIAVWKERLL